MEIKVKRVKVQIDDNIIKKFTYSAGYYELNNKINSLIYGNNNILSIIHTLKHKLSKQCKVKCCENYLKLYIDNSSIRVNINKPYMDYKKYKKIWKLLYKI